MRHRRSALHHTRHTACALLGLLAAALRAQKIEFQTVKPEVLEERLHRVTGKIGEREHTLHDLFQAAGCKGERLTEQAVRGSRTPNLLCTLEGTEDAVIVVAAHYDKVSAGDGAVDNWSGVSMLPSLYQSLSTQPRRSRFVFIGFTREEDGLVGSRFYVKKLDAGEKVKIRAMVNLECLGLSPTKVWASRADKMLLSTAFGVARAVKEDLTGMNVDRVGDTDSRPFVDAKIPVIDFHSVTGETFAILHSARDTVKAIHLEEYEKSYRFLAAYLVFLDRALEAKPAEASR